MADIRTHILVVDDEPPVRRLLRACFETEGFHVSEAESGREVLDAIRNGSIDLITLDLSLGTEDGLAIARQIQDAADIPIVMVTGKGDTIDTVVGLELGADDYITKPFHVREVLARVKSVLRRSQGAKSATSEQGKNSDSATFSFSGWTLKLGSRTLHSPDNQECSLTTGEYDLLRVLVQNRQRILSRDQIMDQVKGHDWSPLDRSIDNQIARLRKKIETDPANPSFIKTVRGVGYTFACDVD